MLDKFTHDRIIVGMILSLGIAHLLKGLVKLMEHPKSVRAYWIHLVWVSYIFLFLVDFWWWEFKLSAELEWTFPLYFFVIFYIVIFYLICSLLFPDSMKDYIDYRDYYYSRRSWFFGLLALTFLLDIIDTSIKGKAYFISLGTEYPLRIAIHFILCLFAIKIKKEWFHALLSITFLIYGISWILRKYFFQ